REVRELLDAETRADELDRRVADAVRLVAQPARVPEHLIGARIGSCIVRRVLATGGMGVVYLAEQQRPQRLVALKVMSYGLGLARHLRRFEYEAEILGRLHHPAIAQVYESGTLRTTDGERELAQPWFSMELVEDARTLLQFADERRLGL